MSSGLRRWPEVSDEEANAYRRDPVWRAGRAGAALIAVGWLGLAANFLAAQGLALLVMVTEMNAADHAPLPRRPVSSPSFGWLPGATLTLAVYSLVIAGGYRLRQMRNRRLGITAAVLALVPCSPAVLVGLPVGLWVLSVLADPAVRTAFTARPGAGKSP
jgi:hypothetical protein